MPVIDSLSLVKHNPNITEKIKYFEFTINGLCFTILFALLLSFMIYFERKENKKRDFSKFKDITFRRNFSWTILWFFLIFFAVGALYQYKVFHLEFPYPFIAKVDGIIWFMTIVGIIGAIWAIFARIDAERAFNQSKKTYDALGSTFDFISFFENDKFPEILESIGKTNYEESIFTLYIGFPCVGLLYRDNEKLKKNGPIELFLKLISKLRSIKDNLVMNIPITYTLKLGCFNEEISAKILKGMKNINADEKIKIEALLVEFYALYNVIQSYKNENLNFILINDSEKFRFASINPNFKRNNDEIKKKAFTWVVKITEEKGENGEITYLPFDSFVFQTSEDRFISLLEQVF